jgi:hypothetical protein
VDLVAGKESKVSTDDTARRASGGEPTTAVWREQALMEISAQRFTAEGMQSVDPEALAKVHKFLENADDAAVGKGLNRRQRLASSWRGASVERTWGQINAAEEAMLRIGPDEYVRGQLPRVLRRVRRSLPAGDARRAAVEEIVRQQPNSPDAGSERGVLLTMLSKRPGRRDRRGRGRGDDPRHARPLPDAGHACAAGPRRHQHRVPRG